MIFERGGLACQHFHLLCHRPSLMSCANVANNLICCAQTPRHVLGHVVL